jgi:hypothetical protein
MIIFLPVALVMLYFSYELGKIKGFNEAVRKNNEAKEKKDA